MLVERQLGLLLEMHEPCHFHHLDHTDAFWSELGKVMPAYGERKEWLRVYQCVPGN
ncbi:MAG TPA: M48 family metallopeptidase [Sulfuriferula sp.]|nr:M48 family metallopeptidase [Sulfuriferula sp.]